MKIWLGVFGLVLLTASPAFAEDQSHCSDAPDFGSTLFVKNSDDAIRIAFVMWSVANPNMKGTDEAKWAKDFTATLHQCVWDVEEIQTPPSRYPGFWILIGARDGRYLGATVTDD